MRAALLTCPGKYCAWTLLLAQAVLPAWADDLPAPVSAEVTNVSQIPQLASQMPSNSYSFHLQGHVWWANPASGRFVFKDNSGAEELEMDWQGQDLAAGKIIVLEGNGTITPVEGCYKIGTRGPVVDNDGVHGMNEKDGAVFLRAGRNPIRLDWFNRVEKYGLEVDYQGPGVPRQRIPDAALSRLQVDNETHTSNWIQGLDYRCAEAPGEMLPDFDHSAALASGTVKNFDVSVMVRPEHIGLCFNGFLDVPADGLYTFYTTSDDGSQLFVGTPSLHCTVRGNSGFPRARPLAIGQTLLPDQENQWVQVEGKVTFASEEPDGLKLEISARTGHMNAEIPNGSGLLPAALLNRRIRATGFGQGAATADGLKILSTLLVPDAAAIESLAAPDTSENAEANSSSLPLLLTAAEVHRLKREEAQKGYPVKVRGVITSVWPEQQAFTIQDSTRGIYVIDFSESRSDPPRIGEFLEVEGVTDPGLFAPIVDAKRVRVLGAGDLPEPIHPNRDQLINGSLDGQYVEIQGVLTSVQDDSATLLTADGRIKADLRVPGLTTQDLARYEDALIRVRGCLLATWDYVTHKVKVDEFRINGGSLTVDQPAPADLFAIPRKTASDLLLFDPQAGVFQRVKVAGQIIHQRDSEFFMMDGNNGVRFIAKHPAGIEVGDLVEVVGFPELSSAAPVLREAVVRKTGEAALPKPRDIGADDLTRADLDSTRVQVKALLVNQRMTPTGLALEMRAGLRSFLAMLPNPDKDAFSIPVGSQLQLTGTCVIQGVSQDVAFFGLLLNSPSDVMVLAQPPWWTLQKLIVILGALGCGLAVTVLWITQLRRKVEQRGAELEVQIRKRQNVEQQHAMELERARIAQDLHDELGSGLTEISMLGVRALSVTAPPAKRGTYVEQMSDQARHMVSALDEIVWAMNPTHDSVASMISYFSLYAERFLGLANIAWRLEGPFKPDDHAVDSRHRHQLFLAFKEALTNIVRHSGATEVLLDIQVEKGSIRLTIADNGRGWAEVARTEEMDGIANMRARMEKLDGHFAVTSKSGEGTVVRFDMPLH
jgi:signal transduction histidine kinase